MADCLIRRKKDSELPTHILLIISCASPQACIIPSSRLSHRHRSIIQISEYMRQQYHGRFLMEYRSVNRLHEVLKCCKMARLSVPRSMLSLFRTDLPRLIKQVNNMSLIMYMDDLVLFSDSICCLQKAADVLKCYCPANGLAVNT